MTDLQKLSPALESDIQNYEKIAVVVQDDEGRETAIDIIRHVKTIKFNIINFFKESKESAHKTWRAICSNEKTFTDRLDIVERNAKAAIINFDGKESEIREKERLRLQAIADEQARRERDRLLKKAESLKTPEKAEALREEAEMVAAPVVQVQESEKLKGESTRKIWKAQVLDMEKVPREWMVVDMKALDAFAKATKGTKSVAGIRFHQESTLAITI